MSHQSCRTAREHHCHISPVALYESTIVTAVLSHCTKVHRRYHCHISSVAVYVDAMLSIRPLWCRRCRAHTHNVRCAGGSVILGSVWHLLWSDACALSARSWGHAGDCCIACTSRAVCRFWSFKAGDVGTGIACRLFDTTPQRNRSSTEFISVCNLRSAPITNPIRPM